MRWQGTAGQQRRDLVYDASGTIANGTTPQLLLPEAKSRSFLTIQNISDTAMYLEFGSARATATLTSGVVTSCNVTNAGFGFTFAPDILFIGGGPYGQDGQYGTNISQFVGVGQVGYPAPANAAKAHCVMTGSAPNLSVASITVDNGGAGYVAAPYVFIHNKLADPNGCAIPSTTSGVYLAPFGGSMTFNGTVCPTDPCALYCATTGKAFICKYME